MCAHVRQIVFHCYSIREVDTVQYYKSLNYTSFVLYDFVAAYKSLYLTNLNI